MKGLVGYTRILKLSIVENSRVVLHWRSQAEDKYWARNISMTFARRAWRKPAAPSYTHRRIAKRPWNAISNTSFHRPPSVFQGDSSVIGQRGLIAHCLCLPILETNLQSAIWRGDVGGTRLLSTVYHVTLIDVSKQLVKVWMALLISLRRQECRCLGSFFTHSSCWLGLVYPVMTLTHVGYFCGRVMFDWFWLDWQ